MDINPLKRHAKFTADNILNFLFMIYLFFRENKFWQFMWIISLADDSHDMSRLFSEIIKVKLFSTAVAIGALRVKRSYTFYTLRLFFFFFFQQLINIKVNPYTANHNFSRQQFWLFFLFAGENRSWHFMWIVCQADNSHRISTLVFSENRKNKLIKIKIVVFHKFCLALLGVKCVHSLG